MLEFWNLEKDIINDVDLQPVVGQQQHRGPNVQRRPHGHGNVRCQLYSNNIIRSIYHIYRIRVRRKLRIFGTSILHDSGGEFLNSCNKCQINLT